MVIHDTVEDFHLLKITKAMKAQRTYFISFIKLLFSDLKKKTIYEAHYCFHENMNSPNFETVNHIAPHHFCAFIVLWKHTCGPITMHILSKLFYKYRCRETHFIICQILKRLSFRWLTLGPAVYCTLKYYLRCMTYVKSKTFKIFSWIKKKRLALEE